MIEKLSSSQITTYLMCPRKYRYRYSDKLEPESRSANMAFGSAVHAAIAWWWQERIDGRSPKDEDAMRVFRADWLPQVATGDLDYGKKEPESSIIIQYGRPFSEARRKHRFRLAFRVR